LQNATYDESSKIQKSALQKRLDDEKTNLDEVAKLYTDKANERSNQYLNDLKGVTELYTKGKISYSDYTDQKRKLDSKYAKDQLIILKNSLAEQLAEYKDFDLKKMKADAEARLSAGQKELDSATDDDGRNKAKNKIDEAKAELDAIKKASEEEQNIIKKLGDIRKQILEQGAKDTKQSVDDTKSHWLESLEKIGLAYQALYTLVGGLIKANIERQLNAIQDQIDANNKLKETETENINNSTLSAQEKATQLILLDKKVAASNEALQKKAREEKRKEAEIDKANAIFSIVLNTAKAIVTDLDKPWKIPFDIAIGAAELAVAIATPLPKYAKGTDDAVGGPSVVSELGKELVIEPSGKTYFTPDRQTIMDIPKHSKIISHDEVMRMISNDATKQLAAMPIVEKNQTDIKLEEIKSLTIWQTNTIVSTLKKQKTAPINIHIDNDWNRYLDQAVRT